MRFVVLGIGLLGLAVLAALWLTTADNRGEARAVEVGRPRSHGEASHDREESTFELATPSPLPVEPEAFASESASTSQRTSPPDGRPTISGHVVVAGGLPAEEVTLEAVVFYGAVNQGNSRKLEAPVAPDGSFSLRLPASSRYALLDVEASCLHLPEAVRAQPGESGVVLEPEVFASIAGRVLPPLGLALAVDGSRLTEVKLVCTSKARNPSGRYMPRGWRTEQPDPEAIHATSDGDGAFLIPMVPIGIELFVVVEHPFGPEQEVRLEALVPAERRELVIALEPGMTIAGCVLDENGRPVEGARVSALPPGNFLGWSGDDPRSDTDGRFALTNLERKEWKVCAFKEGLAKNSEVLVDGTSGDVFDLVLTLPCGGCIGGTVAWANGDPAEDFSVSASGTSGHGYESGENGRFLLCGLEDGVYRVEITAEGEGVEGTARAAEVRVGEMSLRLVLDEEPVWSLRGTVADRAGQPLTLFSVSAETQGDYETSSTQTGHSFVVTGLRAREYTIRVESSGYLSSEQRVLVGPRTEPLRFVLAPAGLVRGRVVDARSKAVVGAVVGEEDLTDLEVEWDEEAPRSDSDGRFEMPAASTVMRIKAFRKGYAPSDPVEVTVESGAVVENIVLRLREACRLAGRVLDAEGRPLAGAQVSVQMDRSFEHADANGRGEFALDGLPAGETKLWAWSARSGEFVTAEVVLVPGANSVELRFEKPDPVRLRGVVTSAGQPVVSSLFLAARGSYARAQSGADGRFGITVMRPGACKGWIWIGEDFPDPTVVDVRRFDLTIPDVDDHEISLDLATLTRVTSLDEIDY